MPVEPMPTGEYRMVGGPGRAPAQRVPEVTGGPVPALPAPGAEPPVDQDGLDQHDPETALIGNLRLLAMLVGTVGSGAIAWTSSYGITLNDEEHTSWLVFVLIAAILGAVAGESFAFGVSRWREVRRIHPVGLWRIWSSVLTVLAVAAGLVASTPLLVGQNNLTGRGVALSAVAILGGMSTAATLAAVKQVAGQPLPGPTGQQLDTLLRLRRMVSRLLSQLGVLVLLIMVVNAAATGFGADLDPAVVIFSGVVASFLVGTMYVPTATTLRRRSALFVDRNFTLAGVPKADLIAAADDRAKLEKLLGLDQTTFGELKAGLVVLTPVAVSLLATLIPKF